MVFGNMGNDSGTGVAFTRDPATGENDLFGEYLVNAQGEDVVAGIRTPKPLQEMSKEMPKTYGELLKIRKLLESHYHEVQDFEFTIEKGTLYILQTRNGKMNAQAIVRTAVEMVKEGLINKEQAVLRLKPEELEQLLHKRIDPNFKGKPVVVGLPASPGAAVGKSGLRCRRGGTPGQTRREGHPRPRRDQARRHPRLLRRPGHPDQPRRQDLPRGRRGPGHGQTLRLRRRRAPHQRPGQRGQIKDVEVKEGDFITIDGGKGEVYLGEIPTVDPEISGELVELLKWADEIRTLGVYANADTPDAAKKARQLGADGIGLCRTERMFNAVDRLPIVREMILADTKEKRAEAIARLLPSQKSDFKEIFKAMEGLPVTIRLLDPPLHEFLPSVEELTHGLESLRKMDEFLSASAAVPEAIRFLDPELKESLKPLEKMVEDLGEIKEKDSTRS